MKNPTTNTDQTISTSHPGNAMLTTDFIAFLCSHEEACRRNGQFGLANNIRYSQSSVMHFHQGQSLRHIDTYWVESYTSWLAHNGVSSNSAACYLRTLKSAYNRAVVAGIAPPYQPFSQSDTATKRTLKRAVGTEVIRRIATADLTRLPALDLARSLFIFSYCTRGMAFVDIAHLTTDCVADGYITYCRHKTGSRLHIRILPVVQQIIDRYHTPGSPYLLPLLSDTDPATQYTQYRTRLRYYNKQLHRLGALLHLDTPLTSYTPRHSWASAAHRLDIPLAVIADALGHASTQTTLIYIASIDNHILDTANHTVVSASLLK